VLNFKILKSPKFKKGDVCVFQTPGFENDPDEWKPVMEITGEPSWNSYNKGYWEYPIKGRANLCPEGLLKIIK
jgi:hypothetical protein